MADFTTSKAVPGSSIDSVTATPWGRLEPLIKPEQLRFLHLLGIPLYVRDVVAKKTIPITDDMLKDFIHRAVGEVELETSLTLMPTQYTEKAEYRRQDYEQFSYIKLQHHPISSVEQVSVRLADGSDIFQFPLDWVETANLVYGQFNMIPLAYQQLVAGNMQAPGIIQNTSSSGSFFSALWNRDFVPALMNIVYTAGYPNGMVPSYVNELIGIVAATRVLSQLAAANAKVTGQSLAVDGLSQSISGTGPQVYSERLKGLAEQRAMIVKKLRAAYQSNFVVTAI